MRSPRRIDDAASWRASGASDSGAAQVAPHRSHLASPMGIAPWRLTIKFSGPAQRGPLQRLVSRSASASGRLPRRPTTPGRSTADDREDASPWPPWQAGKRTADDTGHAVASLGLRVGRALHPSRAETANDSRSAARAAGPLHRLVRLLPGPRHQGADRPGPGSCNLAVEQVGKVAACRRPPAATSRCQR